MTQPYESSDSMNTLTEQAYEHIEEALDDQIDYWEDQQAAVALGQFLEGDHEGAEELERIEGEIFMGESLKTMLEASVGEQINTENAVQMVQGYLQENTY
ncbi:hypothetical protein GKQ38_04380 [Candidatus Nanohaloarchaea archaeon]|nr:hypothetical protein GKQ38_04380 [Candidatus Nanohaloarchaea archaeon]